MKKNTYMQEIDYILLKITKKFGQFKKKQYLCKPILDKTVAMANEKSNIIALQLQNQ